MPAQPPVFEPPRWQWVLAFATLMTGATVLGSLASEIIADQIRDRLAPFDWLLVGLLIVAAIGAIALLERRRRQAVGQVEKEILDGDVQVQLTGGLPYVSGFVGRAAETNAVRTKLPNTSALAVVGARGVGTSALVIKVANDLRGTYQQGHVYLDLRPHGRALSARRVLTELARKLKTSPPRSRRESSLGAAASAICATLDQPEGPVLVVLNNVDHPEQVAHLLRARQGRGHWLLAGGPALVDRSGIDEEKLDLPGQADALAMLAPTGPAGADDPATEDIFRQVVDLCGRQPRAVRALRYWLDQRRWLPTGLLNELREAVAAAPYRRAPIPPEVELVAARDPAYAALSPPAARLFRRMSLVPAPLARPMLEAVGRLPAASLDAVLAELTRSQLIEDVGNNCYQLRPPLQNLARLHLRWADPTWRRRSALCRLVRRLARDAEQHAAGWYRGHQDDPDGGGQRDWFAQHHQLLRVTVQELCAYDASGSQQPLLPRRLRRWWFRLAVALCSWYAQQVDRVCARPDTEQGKDRLADWLGVAAAVRKTRTAGSRSAIAGWASNELGTLKRYQGEVGEAIRLLSTAIEELGPRGKAQPLTNRALALLDDDRVEEALADLEQARLHRARADRHGQALTELALGAAGLARVGPPDSQDWTGQLTAAIDHLTRAANAFDELGEGWGFAAALANRVRALAWLGEHQESRQLAQVALRTYEELGSGCGQQAVRAILAEVEADAA